jgi:sugar O-acyltransferase (sialic acid O-acetyltransferase NeuD family)
MQNLAILGAGGGAGAIVELVEALNAIKPPWHIFGFLDDNTALHGTTVAGFPVMSGLESVEALGDATMLVIGVANYRRPRSRLEMSARMDLDNSRFATLIHPLASVSPRAAIGRGAVIFQYAVVSDSATIGDHVLISPLSFIGHHAVIRTGAVIAPQAAVLGASTIGEGAYIGAHAVVKDGVSVSDGAVVGMGAVVVNDVPRDAIVAGNPARLLNSKADTE